MANAYNQSPSEILKELSVDKEKGLSTSQASELLKTYGPNELKQKNKINPFMIFLEQFKSFIIYILLFAVIIALLAREYIDSAVIVAILIFNAFFGFIQEYRAERAIEALKKLTALKARVLRDGKIQQIETKFLVPGDILILEEGDKIPADARILESVSMQTLESSLTGESNPVSKISDALKGDLVIADRTNMVFSGTAITSGRGKAVVISTGMQTEIGKIANLLDKTEDTQTPLQKKLASFGKWIGTATILISIIIFITGVIRGGIYHLLFSGQILEFLIQSKEWLLTAVALAVAAVPEGLPAIVTIALALGVRRMVKKNSLIRKLPSVETLGSTTVICSDKTGTLTKNEMTVREAFFDDKSIIISGEGYRTQGQVSPQVKNSTILFRCGVLCNNATLDKEKEDITGDPTEAALLVSAEKSGLDHKTIQQEWKRVNEIPFTSERKMMSTINVDPKSKKQYVFTKGAPEILLEKCDRIILNNKVIKLSPKIKTAILQKNKAMSSKALRVLGFAYKEFPSKNHKLTDAENKLIFIGLQGMIDPPRPEVKDSIAKCKTAGIRVVMITGDNLHTAEAIAHEIGILGDSINGSDFAKLSEQEQSKLMETTSIFARVEPQHKMQIVTLLQKKGEIVAMTGDGVNDAPAIKKADIGIAMGIKGTDVSKEASDMILQDDNFATIVNSVEEGRGIYQNIQKFINYLLSSNLAEVLIIFMAIILSIPLPLTAIMLLWLNLVTDGLPALALSVDSHSKNLMEKPPKKSNSKIMDRSMAFNIIYVAVLITIAVLSLFFWAMKFYAGLPEAELIMKIQTIAFTSLIIMEFARIQAIRSEQKIGIFSNKYLILAVTVSLALQLAVIYTPLSKFFGTLPLSLLDWGYILGATFTVLILTLIGVAIKNRISWFKED
jgi:P-type Ca2+ transporter type 2C